MHRYFEPEQQSNGDTSENCGTSIRNHVCIDNGSIDETGAGAVYVAIIPVKVRIRGSSKIITTYAAQDPYSTAAFVTEGLIQKLGAKTKESAIFLTTLEKENSVMKTNELANIEVMDMDENNVVHIPVAYSKKVLPISTHDLMTEKKKQQWNHLKDIPMRYVNSQVDILLGINTPDAVKPIEIVSGMANEPYAVRTSLGWAINGPSAAKFSGTKKMCNTIRVDTHLQEMMIKLYDEEFIQKGDPNVKMWSVDDKRWLEIVEEGTYKEKGHYVVPLPFKRPCVDVPDNRAMVQHRAESLKRRLQRDSTMYQHYVKSMKELIEKGYVLKTETNRSREKGGWFIPHHGVYHPRKPEKVRIVCDCSAQNKGFCLNKVLLSGPDLANTLLGVLLRSREDHVGFMADIEAMFHQVRLKPEERKFFRFLWWPGGQLDDKLEEYEFAVHPFGAISSPSCANYALSKTAKDNEEDYDEAVVKTVLRNFYVDDCFKSVSNKDMAVKIMDDLQKLLSLSGFRLTKFICSSKEVMKRLPTEDYAKCVKSLDLNSESLPSEKALGIEWCTERDCFVFNINIKSKELTRRNILSIVSSIFDPMGFLGPIILPAQELCRSKLSWDEEIPKIQEDRFSLWLSTLDDLSSLEIPRCVKPKFELRKTEMHHFADASGQGYGVVTYIRFIGIREIYCSLIFAKARCASLKTMTIPRLELTIASLSVRVDQMLKREMEITIDESYYWTDSTTVLKYINNDSRRFQIFVANRVQAINDGSERRQWRYVNTKVNPADKVSRGMTTKAFINDSEWIWGPKFLWDDESLWPSHPLYSSQLTEGDIEVKACSSMVQKPEDFVEKLLQSVSSWTKLLRVISWILKAVFRLKKGKKEGSHQITVNDMDMAEKFLLQHVQKTTFKSEWESLNENKGLSSKSRLWRLDTFLEDGLIRVGGRLRQSNLPHDSKHPIVIPKESPVARLLIRYCHQSVGHMGRECVLARLRERYWLIQGSTLIRKELQACLGCRKRYAKNVEQKMADLPADRIASDQPPFTCVGIDYFGPYFVKRGRGQEKRYGCIFTCLSIRAIHIELADSLSTDSFINALRRFVARRGQVQMIRSDNGTNFRGAEKELKKEVLKLNQSVINDFCCGKKIKWIFNPPGASHHGGSWERMIRTIRNVLNSMMTKQVLTDEQLRTLMCEVEAVINSRPLTVVSSCPNDLLPITPNDLLTLKTVSSFPPGVFDLNNNYGNRRWRQVQYMAELFWSRWKKEYLVLLQKRQKWIVKRDNVKTGDLVLIIDETTPRCYWRLGIVDSVNMDKRGFVRSAKIKTSTSTIERPISKLCLLKTVEHLEGQCRNSDV